MKRNYLCIRGHLGLGDTIITAPIVREKAKLFDLVCVLAKHHNVPSTEYLFRDVPNVVIRGVMDDSDADFFCSDIWSDEILWMGQFAPGYDGSEWDVSMYRQAGVEFSDRWNKWECVRDEQAEDRVAAQYAELRNPQIDSWKVFLHEDYDRGLKIDRSRWGKIPEVILTESVDQNFHGVRTLIPMKGLTPILFNWRKVIEACDEIHCIASSFAAFIDSIPLEKNPKLFLHAYARPGEPLMKVNKNWEILT